MRRQAQNGQRTPGPKTEWACSGNFPLEIPQSMQPSVHSTALKSEQTRTRHSVGLRREPKQRAQNALTVSAHSGFTLEFPLSSASVSSFQVGEWGNSFLRLSPGRHPVLLLRGLPGPSAAGDGTSKGRGPGGGCLAQTQMHIHPLVPTWRDPVKEAEGVSGSRKAA